MKIFGIGVYIYKEKFLACRQFKKPLSLELETPKLDFGLQAV
jgi:hypothetical protein